MKKKIIILGSTGSVGKSCLDIIRYHHKNYTVLGLAAKSNWSLLAQQAKKFDVPYIACYEKKFIPSLKKVLPDQTKISHGLDGLISLSTLKQADLIFISMSGTTAIIPILEALKAKKTIALSNKESLVMAGKIIMKEANKQKSLIIPVDSEHNAIFQCLNKEQNKSKTIKRIILTCSGGPFHNSNKKFSSITIKDALKHPKWSMGNKITIDSATLMNKALEIIEAKYLFNLNAKQIEVIIHPQCLIHSMVEFIDNSIISQMNLPDMKTPIQYSLSYPNRIKSPMDSIDFNNLHLTFEKPNTKKFLSLDLAYKALEMGGNAPAILNIVNEFCVNLFLSKKIAFKDIFYYLSNFLNKKKYFQKQYTLESLLNLEKTIKKDLTNHNLERTKKDD